MPRMSDLFKQAQSEGDLGRYEATDGDEFLAEVGHALVKTSKNGNEMVTLKLNIVEDGHPGRGQHVWHNVVLSERSAARFFADMLKLGFGESWWAAHDDLEDAAKAAIGRQVHLTAYENGEWMNFRLREVPQPSLAGSTAVETVELPDVDDDDIAF